MFNNYELNLQNHPQIINFGDQLQGQLSQQFWTLIQIIEQSVNTDINEKENFLNVINGLQIQTQNRLDDEISKNTDLYRLIERQNLIIDQQTNEIAQLNRNIKFICKERENVFTPNKYISPNKICRTQSLNKQKLKNIGDKENIDLGLSSIKKIFYKDKEDREEFNLLQIAKETLLKQDLNQALEREKQLYLLWNNMIEAHREKQDNLQKQLNILIQKNDQDNHKQKKQIEQQQKYIKQLELHICKLKHSVQVVINQANLKDYEQCIKLLKQLSIMNKEEHNEDLIDTLIEFSKTRETLQQIQQNQQQCQNQQQKEQLSKQIQELKQQFTQYQQTKDQEFEELMKQRSDLLELSQMMNDKILVQQKQIEELQQSNNSLTQLFSKSISDLEKLQDENETLRSKSNIVTSRTQEGSVSQKHFMANRYSTYFDKNYRETLSCKNSYKGDSPKFEFSSDQQKRRADQEMEDINSILDDILNRGFEIRVLDFLNNFNCRSGNFKIQLLWQKLKDVLLHFYFSLYESDCIFESVNSFTTEMKMNQKLELVADSGVLFTQNKIQQNFQQICSVFSSIISDLHQFKTNHVIETNRKHHRMTESVQISQKLDFTHKFLQQLTKLSNQLLQVSQANDKQIVSQIESQIQIQRHFKRTKNKELRDIQNATCKIIMEIFKNWKQEQMSIAQILINFVQGWQNLQTDDISINYDILIDQFIFEVNQLGNHDLGTIICQELKYLKFLYQQSLGLDELPLMDAERVLGNEYLITIILSFLNDQEVLKVISVNKKLYNMSQTNSDIKIRILEIRLRVQTSILNDYIYDPSMLQSKKNKFTLITPEIKLANPNQKWLVLFQKQQQIKKEQSTQKIEKVQKIEKIEHIEKMDKIVEQAPQQQHRMQRSLIDELLSEEPLPPSPLQKQFLETGKLLCPVVQYRRIKEMIEGLWKPKRIIHL